MPDIPVPPSGMRAAGKKLWSSVLESFDLREDELTILEAACFQADLIAKIDKELRSEPLTVRGSMGQLVPHPLVTEVRQHRATQATLLGRIKFPVDDGKSSGVNQQRDAANSRWAQAYGKGA